MTVKDLLAELLKWPNPDAEIQVRVNYRSADSPRVLTWIHVPITDVDDDHGLMIVDTETVTP